MILLGERLMKCDPTRYPSQTRSMMLISLACLLLLIGCSTRERPELGPGTSSLYKISFDSNMSVLWAPRVGYDSVPTVLADVVEIRGRVIEMRSDTLPIAPSYVLIADRDHPGERRTIRWSGRQVLPDLVLVPVRPGVRIEPLTKSRLSSMTMPILLAVSVLLYFRYSHW